MKITRSLLVPVLMLLLFIAIPLKPTLANNFSQYRQSHTNLQSQHTFTKSEVSEILLLVAQYNFEITESHNFKLDEQIRSLNSDEMRLFFDLDSLVNSHLDQNPINHTERISTESGVSVIPITTNPKATLNHSLFLLNIVASEINSENSSAESRQRESLTKTENLLINDIILETTDVAINLSSEFLDSEDILRRDIILEESNRLGKHPFDLELKDIDSSILKELQEIQTRESNAKSNSCRFEVCTVWSSPNWGTGGDCPYGGPCVWASGYNPRVGEACEWKCDIYIEYPTPSHYKKVIGTTNKARNVTSGGQTSHYFTGSGKTVYMLSGGRAWLHNISAHSLATQTQVTP